MSLPHENLVAWQRADDLFIELHRLTHEHLPRFERFELGSQIRRAAWSVAANIVEGIARGDGRDSIRFLQIARSSLSEVGYGLHASMRLGYLSHSELANFEKKLQSIGAPLKGLIRSRRATTAIKAAGTIAIAFLAVSILAL